MTALENAKYGFRPARQSHVEEHASCVVVLREQEEVSAIAGELLVEVSNAVDRHAVANVFPAALNQPHEGNDPEQVERRKSVSAKTWNTFPTSSSCPMKPSATKLLEREKT
jgi:hypothetical protein